MAKNMPPKKQTVLFDIGHPGHVHYFKNTIRNLEANEKKVVVTARDKDVAVDLLKAYGIDFHPRGKGMNSRLGKLAYMLWADLKLLNISRRERPDVYVSFSSPYAAQVAWLRRKPHIALNDTEHTDSIHQKFTYPFSVHVVTPESYLNDLGAKQIRFAGIMDALYLAPKYFKPDESIFRHLGIEKNDPFVILRFISWQAHHDYGHSGIPLEMKRKIIELLSTRYKVFISAESALEGEFEQYRVKIPPEMMHSVLNYASLFVGESGTMATESAYLGTHAVTINSLPPAGCWKLLESHDLLKHFSDSSGVIPYIESKLLDHDIPASRQRAEIMRSKFVDAAQFLTDLISQQLST